MKMKITQEAFMSGYCMGGVVFCLAQWRTMPLSTPWKVALTVGLLLVAYISNRTARRLERELTERPSRNNALYIPKPNKDAN